KTWQETGNLVCVKVICIAQSAIHIKTQGFYASKVECHGRNFTVIDCAILCLLECDNGFSGHCHTLDVFVSLNWILCLCRRNKIVPKPYLNFSIMSAAK